MLICNSPFECVHNKIFVENVIWKYIYMFGVFPWFFLSDKGIFFFWWNMFVRICLLLLLLFTR